MKHYSETARLCAQAQKGNNAALSNLTARIEKRLYRFCLFLTGNKEAAKDLAQEGYIKILENIHTLKEPDKFVSWLFKLTKNEFLDYVRSAHHKRSVSVENYDNDLMKASPKSELKLQISQALTNLSPEERYLVLLVCLEGHSYADCAELVGISEDAVRCKLYRLRKSVKRLIHTQDLNAA